jgi:hypothetical protein
MTYQDIVNEIALKYGEALEMVPTHQLNGIMLNILVNMVLESRQMNEYYKKRLEACRH